MLSNHSPNAGVSAFTHRHGMFMVADTGKSAQTSVVQSGRSLPPKPKIACSGSPNTTVGTAADAWRISACWLLLQS